MCKRNPKTRLYHIRLLLYILPPWTVGLHLRSGPILGLVDYHHSDGLPSSPHQRGSPNQLSRRGPSPWRSFVGFPCRQCLRSEHEVQSTSLHFPHGNDLIFSEMLMGCRFFTRLLLDILVVCVDFHRHFLRSSNGTQGYTLTFFVGATTSSGVRLFLSPNIICLVWNKSSYLKVIQNWTSEPQHVFTSLHLRLLRRTLPYGHLIIVFHSIVWLSLTYRPAIKLLVSFMYLLCGSSRWSLKIRQLEELYVLYNFDINLIWYLVHRHIPIIRIDE